MLTKKIGMVPVTVLILGLKKKKTMIEMHDRVELVWKQLAFLIGKRQSKVRWKENEVRISTTWLPLDPKNDPCATIDLVDERKPWISKALKFRLDDAVLH